MTRVLVLGAGGMLGHKVFQRARPEFETLGTIRAWNPTWGALGIFDQSALRELEASDFGAVKRLLEETRPDWVVNCIGVVKQRRLAQDESYSNVINADLPWLLAETAMKRSFRLIHISTDCVFSGAEGQYREANPPDPVDAYGRSKLAGEVTGKGVLTLRTSMIGREIGGWSSLVEWFLRNPEPKVKGFNRAIFSGLTTLAMADEILRLIREGSPLTGLYHISADAVDKYHLLSMVRDAYGVTTEIEPDDSFVIDRSLNSDRYRRDANFAPAPWPRMIADMAADPTPYSLLAGPERR